MNKKGQIGFFLLFFIITAVIIVAGLFLAVGGSVIKMAADEIVPEISNIGLVGDSNITEYSEYAVTPVNTFIGSFSWLGGIIYFIGIIGLFALAIIGRMSMNRLFIILFIFIALLMIIMSIFVSNIYQDMYDDYDTDLGTELRSQEILSFLILNAPSIFSVVIFASGIILFSGGGDETV